nr:UDP binding domain-containing protein [Heliomicrobium modesticaldum]
MAFKSGTDDMRESAAISIINQLLVEGAVIRAFDPRAIENAKKIS